MPSPFPNLPPERRGAVRWLRHRSAALAGNPWDDPTERDVIVYTPPGYDQSPDRYPAVMVLIGFSGTGEKLLARGLTEPSIAARLDRLIADGCPPFVAVLPDCMTTLGGSQYVDSPGLGAYATYVADELRAFVDGELRTTGRWGVVGHSSGGFGALHLAMRFPGAFQAIASHAGDLGFDLCYLGDLPKALSGVRKLGGLDRFVEAFWSMHTPPGDAFAALNVLCMACAYSPDPAARPIPARLPLDFETGELNDDVLRSWRAFDPIVAVDQHADALRQLDLLFVDAGQHDEYNLQYGARRLAARLSALSIDHVHEEFDGGHRGTRYRFDRSLPLVARALVS